MKTQEKIDLFKLCKKEYSMSRKPVLIEMKPAVYLAIEGRGQPGGEDFKRRIGALYGIAFTVKMTRKFGGGQDYAISKLEAQWWGKDGEEDFVGLAKESLCWKLLIRTPEFVTANEVERAAEVLKEKGKAEPVQEVGLEKLGKGFCVQMLHVGPYDEEERSLAVMRSYAEVNGYEMHGRHHEVYISDPRRVEPGKLKTILRRPVRLLHQRPVSLLGSDACGAAGEFCSENNMIRAEARGCLT
jgi:hypothetical protein